VSVFAFPLTAVTLNAGPFLDNVGPAVRRLGVADDRCPATARR
jgi:hypothetical protein